MKDLKIDIRPVTDVANIKRIEEIQRISWKRDDLEVIPGRLFYAMQRNGACLMGAFDHQELVGFVFGVLGTVEGLDERIDQVAAARLLMYSVIMGVLPDYQKQGIGHRLKLAQREFALRIGVRLITWTYDPLESLNGFFNFHKLGVVCHTYLEDYYGEMGGINVGLPSDRFYVEWWVTSNRVKSRVSRARGPISLESYLGGRALIANECEKDDRDFPLPPGEYLRRDSNLILVEIPPNIQLLKSADPELATNWRHHSREVFSYYFQRKYIVTDFVRSMDADGQPRSYYVMTNASGQ